MKTYDSLLPFRLGCLLVHEPVSDAAISLDNDNAVTISPGITCKVTSIRQLLVAQ